MIIRPIGDFFPMADDGSIQNPCHISKIDRRYHAAITAITSAYHVVLGASLHSVYLRGSIPRNTALSGVADLDTFALVANADAESFESTMDDQARIIAERYNHIDGIEVAFVDRGRALDDAHFRFLLASQALCIDGSDVIHRLPPPMLGHVAFDALPTLESDYGDVVRRLSGDIDRSHTRADCRWIMKRLVRSGFELVMLDDGRYARDLFPCLVAFTKRFPQKAGMMMAACELAIKPCDDPTVIMELSNTLGGWLCETRARG